jgi:hypothetical protein
VKKQQTLSRTIRTSALSGQWLSGPCVRKQHRSNQLRPDVVLRGVCGGSIHHVWTEGLLLVVPLLHVPAPSGELAEEEFLGQARANALSCADRKVSEHQSNSTIGLGVVEVR